MVFQRDDYVIGQWQGFTVAGWIKQLTDKPGEVAVVVVTLEGYEAPVELDALEKLNGASFEAKSSRCHGHLHEAEAGG